MCWCTSERTCLLLERVFLREVLQLVLRLYGTKWKWLFASDLIILSQIPAFATRVSVIACAATTGKCDGGRGQRSNKHSDVGHLYGVWGLWVYAHLLSLNTIITIGIIGCNVVSFAYDMHFIAHYNMPDARRRRICIFRFSDIHIKCWQCRVCVCACLAIVMRIFVLWRWWVCDGVQVSNELLVHFVRNDRFNYIYILLATS